MTDGTPQQIAYQLLRHIAFVEQRNLDGTTPNFKRVSREWILWTYAQCVQVASDPTTAKATMSWPIPKE